MKVRNETNYDTHYLRRLFLACEKHEGTDSRYRHVKVIYWQRSRVSGYAWYNSNSVVMKLPKDSDVGTRRVAQTYIHEVGHNLGLRHKDMVARFEINTTWLPDEEVPLKKVKPAKPKQPLIEKRAAHAQKMLDKHLTKFKREKNLVTKYRRKVAYYEKRMAADLAQKYHASMKNQNQ